MSSITEICNLAIGHLGVAKEISNYESDTSIEAKISRRFYETIRDQVLRDHNWAFATQIEALALISEDPNTEWKYLYRYPTNCSKMRRILSGQRNDDSESRIPYRIAFDNSARVIFTDEQNAVAEYTYKITDPTYYSSDFVMALSYRMASVMAPSLTNGDPYNLAEKNLLYYSATIEKAITTAYNEEQRDNEPISSLQRVRE